MGRGKTSANAVTAAATPVGLTPAELARARQMLNRPVNANSEEARRMRNLGEQFAGAVPQRGGFNPSDLILDPAIAEKVRRGQKLTPEEQAKFNRVLNSGFPPPGMPADLLNSSQRLAVTENLLTDAVMNAQTNLTPPATAAEAPAPRAPSAVVEAAIQPVRAAAQNLVETHAEVGRARLQEELDRVFTPERTEAIRSNVEQLRRLLAVIAPDSEAAVTTAARTAVRSVGEVRTAAGNARGALQQVYNDAKQIADEFAQGKSSPGLLNRSAAALRAITDAVQTGSVAMRTLQASNRQIRGAIKNTTRDVMAAKNQVTKDFKSVRGGIKTFITALKAIFRNIKQMSAMMKRAETKLKSGIREVTKPVASAKTKAGKIAPRQ